MRMSNIFLRLFLGLFSPRFIFVLTLTLVISGIKRLVANCATIKMCEVEIHVRKF